MDSLNINNSLNPIRFGVDVTTTGLEGPWGEGDEKSNKTVSQYVKHVSRGEMSIIIEYLNTLLSTTTPENYQHKAIFAVADNNRTEVLADSHFGTVNSVLLAYQTDYLWLSVTSFISHGDLINEVTLDGGMNKFTLTAYAILEELMNIAIRNSSLKGGYLTMPDGDYSWREGTLKSLDFDSILLPHKNLSSVKHYVNVFKEKGVMLRYMFSGIPGSGKTESTRVISSILNKEGVTIIKTNPCSKIKEKVELAKTLAPALIIMDDIDLYLGNRNANGYTTNLGDFLDILDGVNKLPDDVGIIASTNAPHLVDLAAQRSGRFNKILFFGEITLDNVKGIVDKSLNHIFEKDGPIRKNVSNILKSEKLAEFFHQSKKPGAYIYETVRDLKYKFDVDVDTVLDVDVIIEELKADNKLLEDNLKSTKIEYKFNDESKPLGFR
jgi:hypothetical protein